MTVYDRNADANTAVTAFLAQFKLNTNGDIRFVSGTDTFHVWWLHRALQKSVYDFAISGDDELNLSKPNPSTSEALGTIITLLDHTTDYSINYNITSSEAEYLFGGSVTQNNGDDSFRGLIVVGSVNNPSTELQIIQNNLLVTSHWGTGKNQTDSNTLLRILIQTRSGGTTTDGHRVIVKANEWGDTYAVWRTTLGLTESTASIQTQSDPQNTTLLATVQGYTGISNTEGYQLIDVGDGSGNKPYLSQWTYGANNKKALYEWAKSLMVRGTADTIYGIDGDLFTGGPTFSATLNLGAGGELWVQNEIVSWTEAGTPSTGILMAVDNTADDTATELWVHILTGIAPTATTTINGAAASQTVATVTNLSPAANHLGQFTGSWIGAFGIGFVPGELTQSDSVQPLDGSGPLSPPNNVPINVAVEVGLVGDDPHVFLAKKDPVLNAPDYTTYTVGAGNTSGNGTFVVTEAIASDTPQAGYIGVLDTTGGALTYEFLEYTSWTGSTFTLAGTLPRTYTSTDPVFLAIFYESATGGGTTKTVSSSLIYNSDIDVIGWVRHGDPANPDRPVPISGTIGSAGLSLTVVLDDET